MRGRPASLAALLLLGACAAGERPPELAPTAPAPATLAVEVPLSRGEAIRRTEGVVVRCWLDAVLGGAAALVDRRAERITVDGEAETLLTVEFAPAGWSATRVLLRGPVLDVAGRAARLRSDLERVGATADPAAICPERG